MLGTIKNHAGSARRIGLWSGAVFGLLLMVGVTVPAHGWMDTEGDILEMGYNPNGVFVLDGSFVMNVGEVQINITNFGLIGSAYSTSRPWSDAPSCQWPSGSGNEYLWASGLWVGGIVLGERLCSTGGGNGLNEFAPLDDLEYTIYEAVGTKLLRPTDNPEASGRREPQPSPDDDDDGLIDEEILNGFDDDEDGKIDEDFGQIGNQMFVLTNFDNTRLSIEGYPDHTPMNLEMIQTTFQWENDQVDDFVGFDYTINNVGVTDIEDVYVGFYSDSDIGPRGQGGTAEDDMAGSWPDIHGSPGLVRASDGSFVPIQVGYMYDAAESGRLEGYFGVVFLGHNVDPSGRFAPKSVGMRTFQSFSGLASFEQGGDPTNDEERYILLSSEVEDWDNNTLTGKQADFRFLVSAGPFALLPPGESLTFQVGMVVGPGLGDEGGGRGLLGHCAEAVLTWDGIWTDRLTQAQPIDGSASFNPGILGRETILCRSDFPPGGFDNATPDYMDATCLDEEWLIGQPRLTPSDIFEYQKYDVVEECAMFNMDNCFECNRQNGYVCGPEDFMGSDPSWTCNVPNLGNPAGCTGIDGMEFQIHWLVGMAPPPPGLRLWATDSRIHVYWDDDPEFAKDIRLQEIDFESYRIWRADNWDRPFGSSLINGPESALWQMISEYDVVNSFVTQVRVDGEVIEETLPLGANTGLEVISYRPVVLDDPRFEGLAEAMQEVVDNDPNDVLKVRPAIRNSDGLVIPQYQGLVPWETYPSALDTFFDTASRLDDPENGVREKRGKNYYEYVDRDIHNGFIYFYSVTSSDHELKRFSNRDPDDPYDVVGPGLVGDPGSSFNSTVPGTQSQTAEEREKFGVNIYVYPNPATREALAEYQELKPNGEDPTGVRVTFTNLPQARNTIQIYTVSGDLVQSISHSGLEGSGHTSWNLMSRNGQEIVSGVYLYTVQSDDDRFEDFVGKFVVVR
ncbi:MAG: hypothetical protein ABFS42_08395 [Candidatus Krumholzibacteriota bacterium]